MPASKPSPTRRIAIPSRSTCGNLRARRRARGHSTGQRTFGYGSEKVGEHFERIINDAQAAQVKRIFQIVSVENSKDLVPGIKLRWKRISDIRFEAESALLNPGDSVVLLDQPVVLRNVFPDLAKMVDTWTANTTLPSFSAQHIVKYKIRGRPQF